MNQYGNYTFDHKKKHYKNVVHITLEGMRSEGTPTLKLVEYPNVCKLKTSKFFMRFGRLDWVVGRMMELLWWIDVGWVVNDQ